MTERKKIAVSIHELIGIILRLWPVIVCWSLLCCTLLYCYKAVYKAPVFSAETSIYVLSRTADSDYGRLDVSDLDVSRQMTNDAMNILGTEQIAQEVLVNLEGDALPLQTMSAAELLNMVDIERKDDSLEISITVRGQDPYIVCEIANTYRETAIRELNERIMARGVQTVKEAYIPTEPSGRPAVLYGAAGLCLGLVSSIGLIILIYIIWYAEKDNEDMGEI